GSQRQFAPDGHGGLAANPGDFGVLTPGLLGGYYLSEDDGDVTAFNGDGSVGSIRDPNGNQITAGYTAGRLTSLTSSSGPSLTFAYNPAGRVTSVSDSTGRAITYAYDAKNQYLKSVTDFAGRMTRYTYMTSGDPRVLNSLVSVQNPDGTINNFTYDSLGRLQSTYRTDVTAPTAKTQQLTYGYGPGPGDVSVTDADDGTMLFAFDEFGLLTSVVDGLRHATHYF